MVKKRILLIVLSFCCILMGCTTVVPDDSSNTRPSLSCEVQLPSMPLSIGDRNSTGGTTAQLERIRIHRIQYEVGEDGVIISFSGENTNGEVRPSIVSFNWELYDSNNIKVEEGYFSAGSLDLGETFDGKIQVRVEHSGEYRFVILSSWIVEDEIELPESLPESLGVRILMFADLEDAQALIDEWSNGEATEERMITLMKHHFTNTGIRHNTTDVYRVGPGSLVPEIDAWCFDPSRAVGDVAIIPFTNVNWSSYAVCYISYLPSA